MKKSIAPRILGWSGISLLAALLAGPIAKAQPPNATELYLFGQVRYSWRSMLQGDTDTALYRVANARLITVPVKTEPPDSRRVAMPYATVADTELRVLAILGEPTMPVRFRVLSMDAPEVFRQFQLDIDGQSASGRHLCDIPGRGRTLFIRLMTMRSLGPPHSFRTLDVTTGKWSDASPDLYSHIREVGGGEGYEIPKEQGIGVRQRTDGQMVVPVDDREIPVGPPLPAELRFPAQYPWIVLRNGHMLVAVDIREGLPSPVVYRVFDERGKAWRRLEIPGNRAWNVRAFGPWMSGIIDSGGRGQPRRPSPGRPEPDDWSNFDNIDTYLLHENIYRSGQLFVYNVETNRYYEWDTHNGDCEVILVETGQVYYRVDRAIYRAPIEAKDLGKPVLVVEDKAVPTVHWAFWGPPPEVQRPPKGKGVQVRDRSSRPHLE
jgi:hypothetical protein